MNVIIGAGAGAAVTTGYGSILIGHNAMEVNDNPVNVPRDVIAV